MLLAMFVIAFFAGSSSYSIIHIISLAIVGLFSLYLVTSVKKQGFAAMFCIILGCITIFFGLLAANDAASAKPFFRFQFLYDAQDYANQVKISKEILHTYSAVTGAACIALGLAFAYKPTLIQVKNYLPFEYPYPIWQSNKRVITKFSKGLIPIKDLLTEQERLRCCRFNYLLVSIEGKLHLVEPNEKIPEDSQIMRTKSGNTLCGISRSR